MDLVRRSAVNGTELSALRERRLGVPTAPSLTEFPESSRLSRAGVFLNTLPPRLPPSSIVGVAGRSVSSATIKAVFRADLRTTVDAAPISTAFLRLGVLIRSRGCSSTNFCLPAYLITNTH